MVPASDQRIFRDVVAFRGGFVAIGGVSDGPGSHAFVLHSSDGVAWEGRPDDAVRFAGLRLAELVVVGDRLFALGSVSTNDRGGSRASVWISGDGVSWREANGPFNGASVSTLADGDDGIVLIGASNADGVLRAWRSEDGEAWEAASLDLPVPIDVADLGPMMPSGDDLLSVGSIGRGPGSPRAPVAWRSGDGVAWTCQLLDAASWPVAGAHELHRSDATFLAIGIAGQVCGFGGSCPGHSLGWVSDGGRMWTAAIVDEPPIGLGGTAYAASGAGFVAVSSPDTWISADGVTWIRVRDDGTGAAMTGQADALVFTDDGRIVAAGTSWIAVGELSP
ncbi:MAG: hypothetical protein ACR2GO_02230 [Candidatus Limnocylindria bacterium]